MITDNKTNFKNGTNDHCDHTLNTALLQAVQAQGGAHYAMTTLDTENVRSHNQQQAFHLDFTPNEVIISSHGDPQRPWISKMNLKAYGEPEAMLPVGPAHLQAGNNRVSYQRGLVTEWYINGSAGVEQGFTVSESLTP